MNRSSLLALGLTGLLLVTLLYWIKPEDITKPFSYTEILENTEPDAYIVDASSTKYGKSGYIDYYLKAEKLLQFTGETPTKMVKPHITIPEALSSNSTSPEPLKPDLSENSLSLGAGDWIMKSNQGLIFSDKDRVDLTGNVIIVNKESSSPVITVQTEKLVVHPQQEYAETDQLVTIINGPSQVTSVGMKIYFKQYQIVFSSKVKGLYDPLSNNQ